MKILIVSQYFWPETFIINDLVEAITNRGHSVKVLTGKPNYPDGEIFSGYQQGECLSERFYQDTQVFRVPLRPRKKAGAKNLFLNYLSFIINGMRYFPGEVSREKYDIIFSFCPSPITAAIPAVYLKYKLKVPLVVWVQDLWPESLSATGFLKNKLALWFVSLIVRGIYKLSDSLLVQSSAFVKPMLDYTTEDKIQYYPNSFRDNNSAMGKKIPKELEKLMDENFCVVFAGNLGSAQSLGTVMQAADQLKGIDKFKIIIIGSGSKFSEVKEMKKSMALDDVILTGRLSPDLMSTVFSQSSALLVSLSKDEIFSYTIPSKIQAYLSSGRPIIGALDGEGARVIDSACAGYTSASEDASSLAENMRKMYSLSPSERKIMGDSGRTYYLEHFEMEKQTDRLLTIFEAQILAQKEVT